MKKDIKQRDYKIKEAILYYILGYKKYKKEKAKDEKYNYLSILKSILEIAKKDTKIKDINITMLNKIPFAWTISSDEFIAYATCIFYVLTSRETVITDEKIVKEFLSEIYMHHPRKTLQEANFILDKFFPNVKN